MEARERVRVWDLPTRIFHWLLAVLVVFSFVSAKVGGAWTDWHFRSGYAILTLLLFRLMWGFAGNRHARFARFVRAPRAVIEYIRAPKAGGPGHNPLGGWSVIAMLAALSVQAAAGLFANDAIASEGPLAKLVSASVSDRLTTLHRWGEKLLIALVALHVGAVLFYRFARGDDRIMPMLSGDRPGAGQPARDDAMLWLRALLFVAVAAGFVGWIVSL